MESKELSPIEELKMKLRDNLRDNNFKYDIIKQVEVLEERVNHWRKLYNEELSKNEELKEKNHVGSRMLTNANMQLDSLQSQLAEKDKEIDKLKNLSLEWFIATEDNRKLQSELNKQMGSYHIERNSKELYRDKYEQLQSELTELKEKHNTLKEKYMSVGLTDAGKKNKTI